MKWKKQREKFQHEMGNIRQKSEMVDWRIAQEELSKRKQGNNVGLASFPTSVACCCCTGLVQNINMPSTLVEKAKYIKRSRHAWNVTQNALDKILLRGIKKRLDRFQYSQVQTMTLSGPWMVEEEKNCLKSLLWTGLLVLIPDKAVVDSLNHQKKKKWEENVFYCKWKMSVAES